MVLTPRPPSKLLWAAEAPRAAWMVANWWLHRRRLAAVAPGDGRAVMLLPGLFNSDGSNFVLARFLRRLGYRVEGWGLGRNLGARTIGADAGRLIARVEALAAEAGPVALVGVSLGGMVARLVAHRRPDLVARVVTVSSPFAGSGKATNVWRAFEVMTGERLDDPGSRRGASSSRGRHRFPRSRSGAGATAWSPARSAVTGMAGRWRSGARTSACSSSPTCCSRWPTRYHRPLPLWRERVG